MPLEALVRESTGLPEQYVQMAVSYIQFLQYQYSTTAEEVPVSRRKLGMMADRFVSISDDFDETPEGFEEYL